MDNLELIKQISIDDETSTKPFMELILKHKDNEFGYIHISYENGKITCIENSKKIK